MSVISNSEKVMREVSGSAVGGARILPLAWLALGTIFWLFAIGARFDIGFAAWLAPIFLLRFTRTVRLLPAIGGAWFAATASTTWFLFTGGNNTELSTYVIFGLMYGTSLCLPYVIDRILIARMSGVASLLLFPLALASVELLLVMLSPFGGGFGLRSSTQSGNLALMQLVSVTGPYGVAFLMGWLASTANFVWEQRSWLASRRAVMSLAIGLAAVLILGGARLASPPATEEVVKIAGVTPSMTVEARAAELAGGAYPSTKAELAKADPAKLQAGYDLIVDELLANTRAAAKSGAKIVMWSETAGRALAGHKPALLTKAAAVAREERIYLLVANGEPFAANETHLIDPNGKVLWSYQKSHPVPLLEPIPPGKRPVPVAQTPYGRLASVICFDADFPILTRVKADILLVPGYDWPENGASHTLKYASQRAIENGYSLFRADYNGLSAAFDPKGRILGAQPTTTSPAHILIADVPVKGHATVYGLVGDVFGMASVAGLLLLAGMAVFRRA